MKKTYITSLPDRAGAFLEASRLIAAEGGNIVRVSYNKAVDLHTLFVDVEAGKKQLQRITARLRELGYLADESQTVQQVMLIELKLMDVPGALTPVLEILGQHDINISYLSSRADGSPYQAFRMGLYLEKPAVVKGLLDALSAVCDVKILEYSITEKVLDSTVFYIGFANEMRALLGLDQRQVSRFLIESNRIMQLLDAKNEAPFKTFEYIRNSAKFLVEHRGEKYQPVISQRQLTPQVMAYIVEPPCGSNTYLLDDGQSLLLFDGGFQCFRRELLAALEALVPDFHSRPRRLALTHADVDHVGLVPLFDEVLVSDGCYENFRLEHEGQDNFREQNPLHAPYCRLSKIISGYTPPPLSKLRVLGRKADDRTLSPIGTLDFGDLHFQVYEGNGGHVRGETVYFDPDQKVLISGDNLVNIKGFSPDQKAFNVLAPYLMTSVNADSREATVCRKQLTRWARGAFVLPGHGMWEQY